MSRFNATEFWLRTNSLIKTNNTTQRKLSLQLGFNERRIETLATSNRLPDAFEVVAIAQALNTTVEYLVTGETPDNSINNFKNELLKAFSDIFSKY